MQSRAFDDLDITSMVAKGDRIGNDADPDISYFRRFTGYLNLTSTMFVSLIK